MKATELRVLNYVNLINRSAGVHIPHSTVFKVLEIGLFNTTILEHTLNPAQVEEWPKYPNSDLSPIPLTEEWLIKFGAVHDGGIGYLLMIGSVKMVFRCSHGKCYSELGEIYLGQHIEYVHQLQNLYFALTGSELTIKE